MNNLINVIYTNMSHLNFQPEEWIQPDQQKFSLRNRYNKLHRDSKKKIKALIQPPQSSVDHKKQQMQSQQHSQRYKQPQILITDTANEFDCFQNARRAMDFRLVSKNTALTSQNQCSVFTKQYVDPPLLQQLGTSNMSKGRRRSLFQQQQEVYSQYSCESNKQKPSNSQSHKTAGSNKTAPTGHLTSDKRAHTEESWQQKNQTSSIPADQMRSQNGSTVKYSLRKTNRPVYHRKPQFLVCLKYEDLLEPIKDTMLYSKSQLESKRLKQSKLDHKKMTNLVSNNSQNKSEGCQCQPKCCWMNQWLTLIPHKELREESNKMKFQEWESALKQIDKDVPRTQPEHPTFHNSKYLAALREVLIGYCKLDPQIGYAQGMNFIAGCLVFHSRNSYDALLVMEHLMRKTQFRRIYLGNFTFGRAAALKLSGQLRRLAFDLYSHLISQGIQLELFVMSWYFSMLGSFLPLEAMHLVIDKFLRRQFAGLNEVILTLLIFMRQELLQLTEAALMMAFSNQRLSIRAATIDWQQVVARSDNLQLCNF